MSGLIASVSDDDTSPPDPAPQTHRTIDRVTKILEEVVYNPGMSFADLARALDAPRSSVHGFIRGLLAKGWLFEDNHRFYLGPAVYGLTLASGHIRAGLVTESDLAELHQATGVTVFLGVQAGDHLIYVAEAGSDTLSGYAARTNIRRTMLETAGGKALLVALPESQRNAFLRRRPREEAALVDRFLSESAAIKKTRVASNTLHQGARFALATVLSNAAGEPVAEVTLVGQSADMLPRETDLRETLLRFVDLWRRRKGEFAREAV
jgi:DNA-binding IclR family transcriptional regulator